MRITIGQVLIIGAVAGGIYASPVTDEKWIEDKTKFVRSEIDFLVKIFKSGEVLPEPKVELLKDKTAPILLQEEPKKEGPAVDKPAQPQPTEASKAVSASPTEKKQVATTSKTKKKKASQKTPQSVKKQSNKSHLKLISKKSKREYPKSVTDWRRQSNKEKDLIGEYVALTLTTGRVVKGIFQNKTNQAYTIQLPGMGPFDYSVDKVEKIEAAQ